VLPTALGCDAVGLPAHHGQRVIDALPRVGCVLADALRWWWIVPSGSDTDVDWPPLARYSVGTSVPEPFCEGPRTVHWPDDAVPYTHPILLYIAVCRVAGVQPVWSHGDLAPYDRKPCDQRLPAAPARPATARP
jgi:hypothetical protein